MMPTIQDVVQLAESLKSSKDDRPQVLLDLERRVDPGSLYYRFLYELSRKYGPFSFFEIGTYVGASAAHMALGHDGGKVLTTDVNSDAKVRTDALGIRNITSMIRDSMQAAELVAPHGPFDVLYIDGNHTFSQAYGEYMLYRSMVRNGGLIIFDDIELKMDGDEMGVLWDSIPDPKEKLSFLHHTGFGVAIKSPNVFPKSWSEASAEASRMISHRRARR